MRYKCVLLSGIITSHLVLTVHLPLDDLKVYTSNVYLGVLLGVLFSRERASLYRSVRSSRMELDI